MGRIGAAVCLRGARRGFFGGVHFRCYGNFGFRLYGDFFRYFRLTGGRFRQCGVLFIRRMSARD
jgi:hypothetical protein